MKNKFLIILSLNFILSSCMVVVGNDIRLEEYPPIKSVKYLDMHYPYHYVKLDELGFKTGYKTGRDVQRRFDYLQTTPPTTGCIFDVKKTVIEKKDSDRDWLYRTISAMTLFIVPYYDPTYYVSDGELIDVATNRVLRRYHVEEKMFWVGSISFVTLIPQFVISRLYNTTGGDEDKAVDIVNREVDASLVHLVTNDAYLYSECLRTGR